MGSAWFTSKTLWILNIDNYYDLLISFLDHINEQQFLQDKFRSMVLIDDHPDQLIEKFKTYIPPTVKTYIKEKQT